MSETSPALDSKQRAKRVTTGIMTPPPTTYTNRACVDSSGSPSNVPPGLSLSSPPPHFLKTCGGKADKAMRMYGAHLKWRSDADIGTIHRRSHEHFDDIKKAYPHFIHGRSKRGMPVCYEQPGKMDLKSLFKRGLQGEERRGVYNGDLIR